MEEEITGTDTGMEGMMKAAMEVMEVYLANKVKHLIIQISNFMKFICRTSWTKSWTQRLPYFPIACYL